MGDFYIQLLDRNLSPPVENFINQMILIIIYESEVIASSFNSYFNSIPTTLSNNINNNILPFENNLVD